MKRKGPGKHYRKGLSFIQFTRMFPDDPAAAAWFVATRWPDGVQCPHCNSDNVQQSTKHKTMPLRCRPCRKWFSVKTGTVMEGSKLGLQTWLLAAYNLTTGLKGASSMKLHRDLGNHPTLGLVPGSPDQGNLGTRRGAVRRAGGG